MDNMNPMNPNIPGMMPVQLVNQTVPQQPQAYPNISQYQDPKQTFVHPQQPEEYNFGDVVNNKEKRRIAMRLRGFNPKDNQAWYQITQKFGTNIKQPELLSIAEVCANSAGIKLDRDAKRRKSVLVKWFQENWMRIQPYLNFVILEDINKTQPQPDMQQPMMQIPQGAMMPM